MKDNRIVVLYVHSNFSGNARTSSPYSDTFFVEILRRQVSNIWRLKRDPKLLDMDENLTVEDFTELPRLDLVVKHSLSDLLGQTILRRQGSMVKVNRRCTSQILARTTGQNFPGLYGFIGIHLTIPQVLIYAPVPKPVVEFTCLPAEVASDLIEVLRQVPASRFV